MRWCVHCPVPQRCCLEGYRGDGAWSRRGKEGQEGVDRRRDGDFDDGKSTTAGQPSLQRTRSTLSDTGLTSSDDQWT